jgi:predicted metal-dependent phosphoesterase TrpH
MIDLHCHTTVSDGTLTPAELLAAARAVGLSAVSITDHDNVDAYDDPALDDPGLIVVPGVELSLRWPSGNCHVLGYGIDPRHGALRACLADLQRWRAERNVEMVANLVAAGAPISIERVQELAGGEQIGRPHMALALIEAGAVASVEEAFARWLGDDLPYYVPRRDLEHEPAIALVHAAGGVAVLAHPYQTGLAGLELAAQVVAWRAMGLDGLEVWYSRHTAAQVAEYRDLAQRLGLIMTVGSDFHGATKPDIALGEAAAGAPADEVVLAALRRRV